MVIPNKQKLHILIDSYVEAEVNAESGQDSSLNWEDEATRTYAELCDFIDKNCQ